MVPYFDLFMLFTVTLVAVVIQKLQQCVSDSSRHSTMPRLWLYVGLVLHRLWLYVGLVLHPFRDMQARNNPKLITNKGTK